MGAALLASFISPLCAAVKLPALFGDRMVLQRSAATPIWGEADPGEAVIVRMGEAKKEVRADSTGRWRVDLDLSSATEGPHVVRIEASNTIELGEVLVGEVWLCSGQSNMAWTMRSARVPEDVEKSANDRIRLFHVATKASLEPLDDVTGSWKAAGPDSVLGFSAVAYYFGRDVQRELNVPVGLIHASWGGTPVEAWTSYESLASVPELKKFADTEIDATKSLGERKNAYVAAYEAWTKRHDLVDRAPTDVSAFVGPVETGEGWRDVKLPGKLPGFGAVWARKIVTLPGDVAGKSQRIRFMEIQGFETVYWNGKEIGRRTFANYGGEGRQRHLSLREYRVPAELVKAGENILAVRVHGARPEFGFTDGYFDIGSVSLKGDWRVKTEYAFPTPSAAALQEMPALLEAPLRLWNVPSTLYNGMIHPIKPYGMRGVLWYQGESNSGNPRRYRTAFPLLISDWRAQWGAGDFPFYHCQIPDFGAKTTDAGASSNWAELREAQSLALALPNTGQAVLIDVGETGDIHPRNKWDPGARLARIALARTYGRDVPFSGPLYDSMTVEGNSVRVRFTHAEGLVARPLPATYKVSSIPLVERPLVPNLPDSPVQGFAVRGADGKWAWAHARIDGETVVVSSPDVASPVAVRYAWASSPTCNLYNAAGLPAAPFRSDAK